MHNEENLEEFFEVDEVEFDNSPKNFDALSENQKKPSTQTVSRRGKGNKKSKEKKPSRLLPVIFLVVALVICIILYSLFSSDDSRYGGTDGIYTGEQQGLDEPTVDNSNGSNMNDSNSGVDSNDGFGVETDVIVPEIAVEEEKQDVGTGINPGLPDLDRPDTNEPVVGDNSNTNEFFQDINGNIIPTNYKVDDIVFETDFVNYEKRRGFTGQGLEMFWLDAVYKGIPYNIQTTYSIWSTLDDIGITMVDMEILILEDESKVISNMTVKENYMDLLN